MSKAKQQGTSHESWIANELKGHGINARRLAEGGADDEGDVEAFMIEQRWILEGKSRQTLNVQATLGKARRKAAGLPVAVVWKRLVKVADKKVRQPVEGERVVVILGWDDFVRIITHNMGTDDQVQQPDDTRYHHD